MAWQSSGQGEKGNKLAPKQIDKYMQCPCDSKIPYARCCRPCHTGTLAPSAQALMRSRYCAYALGLTDYIMATTHKENSTYNQDFKAWRADLDAFSSQTTFDGLKVLSAEEGENTAIVSFTAYLRQAGVDATFSEKSTFAKEGGAWLYKSGENIS
jgi:SEC-C motif-containing protein